MHELSLVEELIAASVAQTGGRSVALVRVRHASTLPEDVLRQAFELLAPGSAAADARLETEEFVVSIECSCGFHGPLGHDDVIGPTLVICPACATPITRERTAELELLEALPA